jgi:hypothetical protein
MHNKQSCHSALKLHNCNPHICETVRDSPHDAENYYQQIVPPPPPHCEHQFECHEMARVNNGGDGGVGVQNQQDDDSAWMIHNCNPHNCENARDFLHDAERY